MYNVTALKAELGDYARTAHYREIYTQSMYTGTGEALQAEHLFDRWFINDEQDFARAEFTATASAYDVTWDAVPAPTKFDGDRLKLRDAKMDVNLDTVSLLNTWLNLHPDGQEAHKFFQTITAKDIPFAKWYYTGQLAKIMEQFKLFAMFQGVYDPAFDKDMSKSVDGILKIVADAITANDIPVAQRINTGVLSGSGLVFEKLEDMGKKIPLRHLNTELFALCSLNVYDEYNEDFQTANSGANALINNKYKRTRLRGRSNITLVPTPEMGVTDTVIITRPKNFIWGSDVRGQKGPQAIVGYGNSPEELKVRFKWSAGFAVRRYDDIIVNTTV